MSIARISRRNILKAGAGLAGALALPTIVTSRGMAAGGTQPLNMQLGWITGGNQIGEVAAKRLGYFEEEKIDFAIQPGGPQSLEALEASRPLDQRAMRRGFELRVIHEASILNDELNRVYLRELVMGGAKVRVTNQQLERMVIMDEQVAVVPVDPANSRRGALIVRNPGLVAGFLDLFHRVWQDAEDLPWTAEGTERAPTSKISPQDKRILELLASGCTDETSAREVGVSVRHLRRTISRLMQELGATSRFEAGVEAARRGWL